MRQLSRWLKLFGILGVAMLGLFLGRRHLFRAALDQKRELEREIKVRNLAARKEYEKVEQEILKDYEDESRIIQRDLDRLRRSYEDDPDTLAEALTVTARRLRHRRETLEREL